ncbi:DUF2142 domain-containing protein [Dorea formicigenerans]|uniref:DUF2142 domain-containing protein n=1 Tax=Dorea formicigenerans TaxID=39486 RepID=UPI0015705BCE|nr:DUF2142 domain-containing protein [Dorea formicigenerans]
MCNVKKRLSLEKQIAITIFLLGIILSIMIPTGQTPDEYSHLNMIGNSVGLEDFASNIIKSIPIEIDDIAYHYDEKIDIKEQKEALTEKPVYTRGEMVPKKISLTIIKHLPATLGIYIGIVLGLPAFWVLQLGEIFALLFYVYICYKALQIIPIKRIMMAWFMIFPMALQQAASINYDAVLIPLCYLYIADVLYLKYEKKEIRLKDIIGMLLIWGLVSYIKMPYVLLIGLIFILPLEKIHINIRGYEIEEKILKKIIVVGSIISTTGIIIGIYIFRKVWIIQILYGFVVEWKRALYLLYSTGKNWGEFLFVSTVGNLGWLDTPIYLGVAIIVFGLVIIFAIMHDGENRRYIELKDVLIIECTAVILCLFVTIALTNHTIMVTLYGSESAKETYEIKEALYQIPYIGGLQGRYYLPICSLFFIPIPSPVFLKTKNQNIIFNVAGILLYIYIVFVLIERYWIV